MHSCWVSLKTYIILLLLVDINVFGIVIAAKCLPTINTTNPILIPLVEAWFVFELWTKFRWFQRLRTLQFESRNDNAAYEDFRSLQNSIRSSICMTFSFLFILTPFCLYPRQDTLIAAIFLSLWITCLILVLTVNALACCKARLLLWHFESVFSTRPNQKQFLRTDNVCAICLDPLKTEVEEFVHIPCCGHIYHKGCIELWFLKNLSCPLCT